MRLSRVRLNFPQGQLFGMKAKFPRGSRPKKPDEVRADGAA